MHRNKGKSAAQSVHDRIDYAVNPLKTKDGAYVSSYECSTDMTAEEFILSEMEYEEKTGKAARMSDVLCYQLRQSFKPGEITPEDANRIGYALAERFTKGNHAFIVATHVDKEHIHNHIIFNAVSLSGDRKFRNFFLSSFAVRRISDRLCLENGLSVIEPAPKGEQHSRTDFVNSRTHRDELRDAIDGCMERKPENLDTLLKFLSGDGYEIKRGKNISVRGKGDAKFIRLKSLGDGYREAELEEQIHKGDFQRSRKGPRASSLLAMIDRAVRTSGETDTHNGKPKDRAVDARHAAAALFFLQQHRIDSLEALQEEAKKASLDCFRKRALLERADDPKKSFAAYREAREADREVQTALRNVQMILRSEEKKDRDREKEKKQKNEIASDR